MVDSTSGIGTLGLVNGSPILFGSQSKIDTQALIEALVAAKQLPAVRVEGRITNNEAKLAAFGDLSTLLNGIRDAVNGLRNPPGTLGAEDNVFEQKGAFLTASGTVDPLSIMAVTVTEEAAAGTFDVVVTRLAKAEKFNATTATDSAALGYSGTIQIGLNSTDYTATNVVIDATDSIFDIRDAFNAVSTQTGVTATVIQTSVDPATPNYELVMTADETGLAINYTDVVGTLISGLQMDKNPLQAVQTSLMDVNGVTVERTSNQIDDVLTGVSFSLFRQDPTETISVEVGVNLNTVKQQIVDFANAYNAHRAFVDSQRVVSDDGELGGSAALFGNGTLRSAVSGVAIDMAASVGGVSGLSTLAELGLTLDSSNRLVVDDATLDDALLNKLDQVRDIFEFRLTASSKELQVLKHEGDFDLSAFDIQINSMAADGSGIVVSNVLDSSGSPVASDPNPFTVSGATLIGKAGTPFEGLELVYTGAAAGETVNVTGVSQGIGDRLYNTIDGLTDTDGPIALETDALGTRNQRLEEDIVRIERRVEDFRQFLILKFAALEAALALSNALLDQVKATTDALSQDR